MAIGISAAAVVATGSATAVAGAEDPTLGVTVVALTTSVSANQSVTLVTEATANGTASKLSVSKIEITQDPDRGAHVSGGCSPGSAAGAEADATVCDLVGEDGKLRKVESVVSLTKKDFQGKTTVKVNVTVTGTVEGKDLTAESGSPATVTFNGASVGDPSPSPSDSSPGGGKNTTGHPSKPAKPTKKTPTSPSSGSGGSSKNSGSGGSSSTSPSTGGVIPPAPNSSFDPRNPQVALPPIAPPSAQEPTVAAPSPNMTPQSRLQGNQAPVAQDLTFDRMARTQIAWLAALLVAFSLLLTQLRLGRRRLPAGAAAAKKTKGTHRRPRRGTFGK